jgi:hypothetical protein
MHHLPVTPPRGKQFAVARMSHIVGGLKPPELIVAKHRFDDLEHAAKFALQFDDRLTPTVIIVDKE